MTAIIVYTTPEVLEHKKRDGFSEDGRECFWEIRRPLKRWRPKDRIYFATKGHIRGYFDHTWAEYYPDRMEICFHSEDWHDIDPIPQKPFQGVKYFEEGIE